MEKMSTGATSAGLTPGAVISNRFEIVEALDAFGAMRVYLAKDQRTKKSVGLWHLPPRSIPAPVNTALRNALKAAATIKCDDALTTFGPSSDLTGSLSIATEVVPNRSVADEIAGNPTPRSVQEAFELLRPALDALSVLKDTVHGALTPAMIRIDQANVRGKLAGFGLVDALRAMQQIPETYVAPELRGGAVPTPRGDVYALGAMLHLLCTGAPPDPSRSASDFNSNLPATFDVIIENCVAENPSDRFENVGMLRGALNSLVAPPSMVPAQSSASSDEGVDIPVDVDVPVDVPVDIPIDVPVDPPPPAADYAKAVVSDDETHRREPDYALAAVPSMAEPVAPRPAPPRAMPQAPPPPPPPAPRAPDPLVAAASAPSAPALNEGQLRDLIRTEAADDTPRWMYVRNGLDHGPFMALEIMEAIREHKVGEDDIVFNMDSGERRKLFEWPQFQDLGAQAREQLKRKRRDAEAKTAISAEKSSTTAKVLVGTTLLAVIGGLIVLYFTRLSPSARQARREAELQEKLNSGKLRATGGQVEESNEPPPPTTAQRRPTGSRSGGHSGSVNFTSYEEAMKEPVDLDMNGGGGGRLSASDISNPLNGALDRMARCAIQDISRGNEDARNVKIRVVVSGTGSPMGASVLTGSGQFKSCILGIVKGLHWRAYGGQRMGFSWGFSVEE